MKFVRKAAVPILLAVLAWLSVVLVLVALAKNFTVLPAPTLRESIDARMVNTSIDFSELTKAGVELRPLLLLQVSRLSPREREVKARLHVYFPDEFRYAIRSSASREAVISKGGGVSPSFANSNLTLTLQNALSNAVQEFNIPLTAVAGDPARAWRHHILSYSTELSVPLLGYDSIYPSDWYEYVAFLDLAMPSELYVGSQDGKSRTYNLRLRPLVHRDAALAPFVVEIDNTGPASATGVHLVFRRAVPDKFFIYGMTLLPMLLALAFAHHFFSNIKQRSVEFQDLMLGAAGFMLAAIPLRSVLVPPELTESVSRVDLLLALAVAVVVAVVLTRYCFKSTAQKAG